MKVEKVANNGSGIVRTESGKVAFVPDALPEEDVTFDIIKEKKSFIQARLKNIKTPSPHRVPAACPHYQQCGGCQLQHTSPEYQLSLKQGWLLDALKRVGKWGTDHLKTAAQILEARSLSPWQYRQRLRLHVKGGHIGFHGRGSHLIQEVDDCLVAFPGFHQVLKHLRQKLPKLLRENNIKSHIEIEVTQDSQGSISVLPVRADYAHSRGREKRHGKPTSLLAVLLPLFQKEFPKYNVKGLKFTHPHMPSLTVPPDSFLQPHKDAVACYAEFIEGAVARHASLFSQPLVCADLYSGAGALTFAPLKPLQKLNPTFMAVEGVGPSIKALKQAHTPYPVTAIARDVEGFLAQTQDPLHLVISDPPRAGMGLKTTEQFLQSQPQNKMFIYVACDSAAFARDTALLLGAGYQLTDLLLCDAFPQTLHFETIGVFIKP